jgi:hypothetical protein
MKDEIGEASPIDQYETDTMIGGGRVDNRTEEPSTSVFLK